STGGDRALRYATPRTPSAALSGKMADFSAQLSVRDGGSRKSQRSGTEIGPAEGARPHNSAFGDEGRPPTGARAAQLSARGTGGASAEAARAGVLRFEQGGVQVSCGLGSYSRRYEH